MIEIQNTHRVGEESWTPLPPIPTPPPTKTKRTNKQTNKQTTQNKAKNKNKKQTNIANSKVVPNMDGLIRGYSDPGRVAQTESNIEKSTEINKWALATLVYYRLETPGIAGRFERTDEFSGVSWIKCKFRSAGQRSTKQWHWHAINNHNISPSYDWKNVSLNRVNSRSWQA